MDALVAGWLLALGLGLLLDLPTWLAELAGFLCQANIALGASRLFRLAT